MLSLSDIVNVKVGIGRGVFEAPGATVIGGKKPSFNLEILKLFANGEQGFFYDPNDLSTMYQDAAGTVPVTDVGQPIGLIRDKSGRNNHAFQTTSSSRPILRQNATTGAYYLEFDGSDDFLQTSNIDFTATDKVSLFAGMQMVSVDSIGYLVNFGRYDTTNKGLFHVRAPQSAGVKTTSLYTLGSSNTRALAIYGAIALGENFVLSAISHTNPEKSVLKINRGVSIEDISADSTGNFGMYPLHIGRFAGEMHAFNGHIYSLIGIGRLATGNETAAIEKELAKRTGVTLNV